MTRVISSVMALLIGAAALNLGLGLQASLLGLRAGAEGFTTIQTGLIMSSYYAGFVLSSFLAPSIVNRVGHIRTFSALASLASAAALLHALFVDPYSWIIFRLITGACFAGLCLVTESWLNERSTNLNRGTLLSIYIIVILAASALGQFGLALAPIDSYELFAFVSVVISIALVPIALTSTVTPTDIEPTWMRFPKLYKKTPVGLIGCLGAGLGTGAFWGLAAVYAHEIGYNAEQTSAFLALMICGGMLSQWPLGKLSDRIDRRYVIGGLCLTMSGVGFFIGLFTNGTEPWLFYMGMAAGALIIPLYSISIAHANDRMQPKDYVSAGASLLIVYGSGATAGPLMATLIMDIVGPEGLFLHAACVLSIVGLFALYRTLVRSNVSEEDMVEFGIVPRTSPMTFVLDPRTDEE